MKKSIPVDYIKQGYIFFISMRYKRLNTEDRERIRTICRQAGEEYAQAVFEFVTTDRGAVEVCMKHHLSESTLERAVRRYYILFAESL